MQLKLTIAAVLMNALLVFAACQNAAPPKIEVAKTNMNTAAKVDEHEHEDNAPRISLEDAKKDFDAGNAIFVDTRAEVSYKQEHIKGAMNIPAEAMETRYKEIPTSKKIIAYCS